MLDVYGGCRAQKTDSRGAKIMEMGKGPIKRGMFAGLYAEEQIPSGQPYPLPKTKAGSRGSVAVCLSRIPGGGLEKSGPSSLPGTLTVADENLGRGYVDLLLLLQEERGQITHGALEGREPSGQAGKGVPDVLHPHELLGPGGGVGRDEASKSRLQVLIGTLQTGC
jgi:hypothetical protein